MGKYYCSIILATAVNYDYVGYIVVDLIIMNDINLLMIWLCLKWTFMSYNRVSHKDRELLKRDFYK